MVARSTPDRKVACSSHVVVTFLPSIGKYDAKFVYSINFPEIWLSKDGYL